jgi:hypothetical protein
MVHRRGGGDRDREGTSRGSSSRIISKREGSQEEMVEMRIGREEGKGGEGRKEEVNEE